MARIVIPGGTGFLGRALTECLVARGDSVVVLTRGETRTDGTVAFVHWDARTNGPWVDAVNGCDAVVHLNGKRVDTRATRRNIDALIRSRVEPVLAMGLALERCDAPPPVWVQGASLAIFGEGGDAIIDESTPPSGLGPREMVGVCLAWEAAYEWATRAVDRRVLLRIGIGLGGQNDPATVRLAQLVRMGLGGRTGSGRQWVSWIALDDLMTVLLAAIDREDMAGLYHLCALNPITNEEMMAVYRRLLGKRFGLATPKALAMLGAPLIGTSAILALVGRRCVPTRLMEEGFEFTQPHFAPAALAALVSAGMIQAGQ